MKIDKLIRKSKVQRSWGSPAQLPQYQQFAYELVNLFRRPNHMHSHLDALQAMAPFNFRRVPHGFHSVAKQASFRIAFQIDFGGFGSDFARVWGTKMDAKIDFWDAFLRYFFRMRFGIDFWWFLVGLKAAKIITKPLVFRRFY